jgi:hypothetical protein
VTRLLEAGTAPRVASELLGHSATSVTWDTYMHVSPRLAREAADRLEATLGTAGLNIFGELQRAHRPVVSRLRGYHRQFVSCDSIQFCRASTTNVAS